MTKFKKCTINISRGDLTIMKVENVESNSMSDAVLDSLVEVIHNADNPEEIDQDYIDECFGRFKNGHGLGEEDCVLFLSEDSEWYYLVNSFDDWSDKLYEEFSDYAIDCTATIFEDAI